MCPLFLIYSTIAVGFGEAVKKQVDFEFEFFPKQSRLTPKRNFGNLIKLPLGIHRKYQAKSKFFSINSDKPIYLDGLRSNLNQLKKIIPVEPQLISNIAGTSQVKTHLSDELSRDTLIEQERYYYSGSPELLISHCSAMRQLCKKAESGMVLERSEAFHYANVFLSVSGGVNEIHRIMQKSLGQEYSPQKTNLEIEKILPLHPTSCKILLNNYICPEYCKPSVRRQNEDLLTPNTTPCSVWLKRERIKKAISQQDILSLLGTKENVELAFYRLKRYYDQEVTIFYDSFDFDMFERRLDEYCRVIAETLTQHFKLTFSGYLPFFLPKKLDDTLKLQYRRMSYSSVYDQVPIQAVFNIIGPIIDLMFHKNSYGYRWNKDITLPHRIFDDWKENYPRFRDDIISSLQENPTGYHICCDIKGFYDNVRHDILLQQFANAINDKYIYDLVEKIVLEYEFNKDTHKGIPQGPAYARLLANLYLNDFDFFISRFCGGYFRYVDDFVLVFDTFKNAENGLNKINKQLSKLDLELSQEREKKPAILPNTDLSKVRYMLDKIRYGILENTKQIQMFDAETVNDFYDAVERHSVTFDNPEQLIKINDVLPSLLYVITQESLITHPLIQKLIAISNYLIRKHWFFPKKLATVFERLLELEPNKQRFVELFDFLEPSQKCFFLISLYNSFNTNDTHKQLIFNILKKSIIDIDPFVCGLSIAITKKIGVSKEINYDTNTILDRLQQAQSWFELNHFLGGIDYLSLPMDEKVKLKKLIHNNCPINTKLLLFENLTAIPQIYLDELFLKNLLAEFDPIFLPAISSLLGMANNKSEFIVTLLNFLVLEPKFKALTISFVNMALSKRCTFIGLAELENLITVFEDIRDPELKKAIFRVLNQNTEIYEDVFLKTHRLLINHNRCFFFEHLQDLQNYTHLELIPEETINEQLNFDITMIKKAVEDLSESGTITPAEFFYDSGKHEIRLQYKSTENFDDLSNLEFNINQEKSVIKTLRLAADTYKKALYFKRIFGKTPQISKNNLLLNKTRDNIAFRTIGLSLQTPLVISGVAFGERESDIPYMIALLIRDLLFISENQFIEVSQTSPKKPLIAFVTQFILNMSGREPSHRYSPIRFDYLLEKIISAEDLSEYHLGVLYLRERLRSALFRHNQDKVTWHGVCGALDEHVSHIQEVCSQNSLQELKIKNMLFLSSIERQKPHYLSKQFINIILNRQIIQQSTIDEPNYGDLIEYLLLISFLCLEITSLSRSLFDRNNPDRESINKLLTIDWINIQASDYKVEVNKKDIAEIFLYNPNETGLDMREISLQKIALLALLSLGVTFSSGFLIIQKPKRISKSWFDDFAHTCLYRIPRVEKELQKCIEDLSEGLRHNDEPAIDINLSNVKEDIYFIINVFYGIRNGLGIKRHYGITDGKKFPEKLLCLSNFHKKRTAKENTLPGLKLTNSFPSSRYESSWDMRQGIVTNLVIPSVGINNLFTNLVRGKYLGYKLSYLYSGKTMVFWDLLIFLFILVFMAIFENGKVELQNSFLKAIYSSVVSIFSGLSKMMLIKIIYDFTYWIKPLGKVITTLRLAWKQYYQGEK